MGENTASVEQSPSQPPLFSVKALDPEKFKGKPPEIKIAGKTVMPNILGTYNRVAGEMIIYEDALIEALRSIRDREYKYLEGKRPGRLEQFAEDVINALYAPHYFFQRDRGDVPDLLGSKERRKRYYGLVNEDTFTVRKPGEKGRVPVTHDERIEYAKRTVDKLLELATPAIIGWIVAHEVEHGNNFRGKLAIKILTTLGPFIGGMAYVLSTTHGNNPNLPASLFEDLLATYTGSVVGRYYDERASFTAGDMHWRDYVDGITVDHDVFKSRVLGNTSEN